MIKNQSTKIIALKLDLRNADNGLRKERYNLNNALERMLIYESDIEFIRNKLVKLGIETRRERPWGEIKIIGEEK